MSIICILVTVSIDRSRIHYVLKEEPGEDDVNEIVLLEDHSVPNNTFDNMDADTISFKLMVIASTGLLSILAVLTNGLCIYIITKSRELSRTPSSCLIRSLLTVHLIQGLVVFPLYVAKKLDVHTILSQQVTCDGFRFTFMTTFYLSVYCMVLIAIDRVFAVVFVIRYREIVTKPRVLFCIVFLWVYIIGLCLSPFRNPDGDPIMEGFFGRMRLRIRMNHSVNYTHYDSVNYTQYSVKCRYNQSRLWTISMLSYNCGVPYLAIVLMYKLIVYKIYKLEKKTDIISPTHLIIEDTDEKKKEATSTKGKKSRNITRVSFILSATYFITWLPSVVYYILWSVCPLDCFPKGYKHSNTETYVGFFTKYLAFLDAIASPVIYCVFSEQFRNNFRSHVVCLRGKSDSGGWLDFNQSPKQKFYPSTLDTNLSKTDLKESSPVFGKVYV